MVAHLLRLRLLLLRNSLTRNVWQLIGVIVGGLYAIGVLGLVFTGLVALGATDPAFANVAVILGGSALILGWVLGPIFVSGSDQSLDLPTLATFPIPLRTLMLGLAAAGLAGIPGLVTSLGALASAAAWWSNPVGILPAVVSAVIGVAICVVASRLIGALTTGLGSSRRYREVIGGVVLVVVILLGPLIVGLTNVIRGGLDVLPVIATALGWSPLGAIWAVPGSVVAGDGVAAVARLLIGLATLAALVWAWARALRHALAEPAATGAHSASGSAGLGLFARFPGTPTGAVAARALGYWWRDPRYSRGLLVVPAVVVLAVFYSVIGGGGSTLVVLSSLLIGLIFGVTLCADVSYDGTAWAAHVSSGVTGSADRAGRVIAAALIGIPAVLVVAVGTCLYAGRPEAVPGVLGMSLALVLSGFGVSSVASSLVVYPVPAPGDSPLKTPPGSGVISSVVMFGSMAATGLLAAPSIVLGAISLIGGDVVSGVVSLAVALVLGSALAAVGIRVGGRIVDRRAPELFAALVTVG
ncbi:transporter [Rathayibacter iranicus]|uniref:Transporter n=2 Tax=Rathayibacter iranicus TaxID=59737 RepID=A0AAD1AE84_9MICO|nr:transporter [Rathayibacter iranicus]AZZ56931.1 transporter [Rathayibacter iranicus]MWV29531.1 transporter [Rathayibacter iranicus NCPPB 2253 = VKM Ac-1602]PPI42445.1 transporter [Rathayibacter iranicus]PPI57867.1 transporter [Rathayibacter iranicus]PPI68805.1 transporter [Rathayibacter iranicus]